MKWSGYFEEPDEDREYEAPDPPSCLFPGRCVMPDPVHWPEECATAEMMEQFCEDGEA